MGSNGRAEQLNNKENKMNTKLIGAEMWNENSPTLEAQWWTEDGEEHFCISSAFSRTEINLNRSEAEDLFTALRAFLNF